LRVIVLGCGKSEVACGGTKVIFGREGGGVGEGAFEEGLRLGVALEVDEGGGAVVEQGGVGGGRGDEGGEEGVGLVVLLVAIVEAGEEAGYGGIFGVRGVKLFYEGDGLGDFILLGEDGGELGAKGGVAGVFGEGSGEEGLGFGGFLLTQQEMREGGGGLRICRGGLKSAAIGGFGSGKVVGGFGEFGGEEGVVRGFGGKLEGGEEFGSGGFRVAGLMEMREGTVGASLERWVFGRDGGGGE